MDDSIEIENELYKILADFRDRLLKGQPIPPHTMFNNVYRFYPMPKEHRFAWCKAMNMLVLYGVISSFQTTSPDGIWNVEMKYTPEEENDDGIFYTYDGFSYPKFKELCKEYDIDLMKPIKLTYSARLLLSNDDILMVDIDGTERLIYRKLGQGTGREILRHILRVQTRRGKYFEESELRKIDNDERILKTLSLNPLKLEEGKLLTEYFKSGLLNDVVKTVIILDAHGICVPEQKEITPMQLKHLRKMATSIERK